MKQELTTSPLLLKLGNRYMEVTKLVFEHCIL